VADLNQVRRLAGQPSYTTLERLSGHSLKRATMSDVLNGRRVNLPEWRFVNEFVAACRKAAAESGLGEAALGTTANWKRHWDGASNGVVDARFPGHDGPGPDRPGQVAGAERNGSAPAPAPRETPSPEASPPANGPLAHDPGGVTARPAVWGPVPGRLPDFVGRETWLARLSDAFTPDGEAAVTTIAGLPGIGKTQLAVEYASRFGHEYDLLCWIPCADPGAARDAMTGLAALAGAAVPTRETGDPDYGELFDVLRRGDRYLRWLLIFDGADEPDEIRALIPPESAVGRVLVTTRNSRWEAHGDMVELDAFDRAESIEFLRRRMRRFADADAHWLAEEAGDLPLLLEHAVESGLRAGEYLELLESDPFSLLSGQPADYHAAVASAWETITGRLCLEDPDAFDLLRCLAFFGSDPVPRESLERGSYLADVSIHHLLHAPIRLARAIARLRRTGLLRTRAGTRSLMTHRATRLLVRNLAERSDDAERFRHDVHLLLAAADPLAPDDPAAWRGYEDLRGHAAASGAVSCREELVRRFVVNLVRYLSAAGDPRAAVSLADEALASWETDAKADNPASGDNHDIADGRVTMQAAKADALFAQGLWPEAFRLREECLAVLRADPDRWTAGFIGLEATGGARFRVAGDFAAALAADEESVRVHAETLGDDDPRTFGLVSNLVTDLALTGSAAAAAAAARALYRNCVAFYGDAGHPAVLAARNVFGRCQRLSGEYGEAVATLAEVHRGYESLADRGILKEDHPRRLTHEIDYAAARRDSGPPPDSRASGSPAPDGLALLADDMQRVRRQCWRTLGADHPQTIAATVVLASILRRLDNRAAEAAQLLEEAGQRYQSVLGPGHPYTLAVRASPETDFTPLPL
jgi:tetratricopeptide (TPR) repeat protein